MNDYDYVRELEMDCTSEKQEMVIGGELSRGYIIGSGVARWGRPLMSHGNSRVAPFALWEVGGLRTPRWLCAHRLLRVLLWGVIVVASTHNSNHILWWGFWWMVSVVWGGWGCEGPLSDSPRCRGSMR